MAIRVPIVTDYNPAGLSNASRALERFGVTSRKHLAAAGAGFGLLAVAASKAFSALDEGYDAIVVGTGATGDALDDLKRSAEAVGRTVPNSFGDVGRAIAEVNTRLGLTGKPLEVASKRFLDLSRVAGGDVVDSIKTVTRVFGDWGIATSDQAKALDQMFVATQKTGISIERLTTLTTQYGAPLRQVGFEFEQTLALFSQWEKEGVNVEAVMSGIRMGLGKMAAAGKEPVAEFNRLIAAISNTTDVGDALAIAAEGFGSRAGPDMAAAVLEGRFEIDALTASLDGAEGAIARAAEETLSANDRFKLLGNQLMIAAVPAVTMLAEVVDVALVGLTALPKSVQAVVVAMAALAIASAAARSAMLAFGTTLAKFVGPVGWVVLGVGALTAAFLLAQKESDVLAERLEAARKRVESLREEMEQFDSPGDLMVSKLTELAASNDIFRAALLDSGITIADLAAAAVEGGVGLNSFQLGLSQSALAAGADRDAVQELTFEIGKLSEDTNNAVVKQAELTAVADDATEAFEGQASGLDIAAAKAELAAEADRVLAEREQEAADAAKALAEAKRDQAAALDETVSAMRAQADAGFAATEADFAWQEQLAESTEAVGKAAEGSQEYVEAQISSTNAAASLADATVRAYTETQAADGITLSAADGQSIWNRNMIASAKQAKGPLRQSIIDYIATVNGIPPEKVSEILADIDEGSVEDAALALDGASEARDAQIKAQALTAGAESGLNHTARNRTAIITAQGVNFGKFLRASHVGTRFAAGEAARVVPGQVFQPDVPGRLLSPEDSQRLVAAAAGSGSGGPRNHFDVKIIAAGDGSATADAFEEMAWRFSAK